MTSTHHLDGFDPRHVVIPEPDFQAPDLIGTVEGWRTWQLSADLPRFSITPRLYSVSHKGYFWKPRVAAQAECDRKSPCAPHQVPGERCRCGFYSAKTLEHLREMCYIGQVSSAGYVPVVGQIACWGKVIEGTQGWRSSHAYPVRLYVPFEYWRFAKALSDGYGVDVKLMNTLPETTTE